MHYIKPNTARLQGHIAKIAYVAAGGRIEEYGIVPPPAIEAPPGAAQPYGQMAPPAADGEGISSNPQAVKERVEGYMQDHQERVDNLLKQTE